MKRTDRVTIIIALVLFLGVAAYVAVYAYGALTDQTVTAEAAVTSVSAEGAASGIVVRSETVLQSTQAYIDISVPEGAKVAAGGVVATAMSSRTGLERAARMHELELEIARVAAAVEGISSAQDLTARDALLRSAVLELTGCVARRELDGLDAAALNLRCLTFDESESSQSELDELRAELESIRGSSSSDTSFLTVERSGVFSTAVDGYEHLGPEDLKNLTPQGVMELINSRGETAGGTYGKLVTDYTWYFAAVMSDADAANLTEGGYASLDFGRYYGGNVSARVESVSAGYNGSAAVVFRCDTALRDTLAMREVSAAVVFDEYNGIRVPSDALREDGDGQEFVWVITAMQLERKDVSVIYRGEDFCVVEREASASALREGNEIVVSGVDLYEGKIMD